MHIFLKKAKREPVFILLAAILVLASAFSCLGFGAWESAMRQVRSIEGSYTTIAVPVGAPSDPAAGAMEYVMDENGNTVGQIRPQYNEDGSQLLRPRDGRAAKDSLPIGRYNGRRTQRAAGREQQLRRRDAC